MNIELVVNTFWFFRFLQQLFTLLKRYVGKKEYSMIDKTFKLGLSVSIFLIFLCLYFLLTQS